MPDKNDQLKQILRLEINQATEMLALFSAEKTALVAGDHASLLHHAERKEQLIGKLQEITDARVTLMGTDSREHRGQINSDTETGKLFASLEQLAAACAAENRSTGLLIHRHSQFISNMLDSLQGNPGVSELTYQADGHQETQRRLLRNYASI